MAAQIIDGSKVAENIKLKVKAEIESIKSKCGKVPKLVAIQAGENPASKIYVKNQQAVCAEMGINYELKQLPAEIDEKQLTEVIKTVNNDVSVNGVILQMPLPQNINSRKMQMVIDPKKDVEGITPTNLGLLLYSGVAPVVAPCTACAVIELLNSLNIPLKGKETVIVGHSEIVGKPVTLMLLNSLLESATPTVCHIATKDLAYHTSRAEVLIVAAGKAGLIKGNMVKDGAIVIDVGINRIQIKDANGAPVIDEKTGKPKMKTVGDVVYDEAVNRAGFITPVPGGVGPVTTTILVRNMLQLFKVQNENI